MCYSCDEIEMRTQGLEGLCCVTPVTLSCAMLLEYGNIVVICLLEYTFRKMEAKTYKRGLGEVAEDGSHRVE